MRRSREFDGLAGLLEATTAGGAAAQIITQELTGESIATVDQHAWLEATHLVRSI